MVAMDPNDPESVEQASAIMRARIDQFATSIKRSIYMSWLQSKDVNAVEAKYRRIVKHALDDFRADESENFLSLETRIAQLGNQSTEPDAQFNEAGSGSIRFALYALWIALPSERRNYDTLELEIRGILDNALYALRGDAYGLEG